MGLLGQAALDNRVNDKAFSCSAFCGLLAPIAVGLRFVLIHRNLKMGHTTHWGKNRDMKMVSSLRLLKWHAENEVILLNALHNFFHRVMKWVAEFEKPFPYIPKQFQERWKNSGPYQGSKNITRREHFLENFPSGQMVSKLILQRAV